MNQKDAAKYVGVSDRMLRSYTRQGRIRAREDKTQPRRTLIYEVADLECLKRTLDEGKRWRLPKPDNESTVHVGFRVDPEDRARLEAEGEKRGLSVGEYARLLVIDALEDKHGLEIERLRHDLVQMTQTLLVHGGKLTPEESESWVKSHFTEEGESLM